MGIFKKARILGLLSVTIMMAGVNRPGFAGGHFI